MTSSARWGTSGNAGYSQPGLDGVAHNHADVGSNPTPASKMEELHINARFEGKTKYTSAAGGAVADIDVFTVALIECGLTGWKDEPYRGRVVTTIHNPENDELVSEHQFSTSEELSTWLEQQISDLRRKGFELVRYKANGLDIDWLAGINLPS